jgi:hypothetical protein
MDSIDIQDVQNKRYGKGYQVIKGEYNEEEV